jgi:hypothetical protein
MMLEELAQLTIAQDPEPALIDHEDTGLEMPLLTITVDDLISIAVRGVYSVIEKLIQCPSYV